MCLCVSLWLQLPTDRPLELAKMVCVPTVEVIGCLPIRPRQLTLSEIAHHIVQTSHGLGDLCLVLVIHTRGGGGRAPSDLSRIQSVHWHT